jgi:hypothetical protein
MDGRSKIVAWKSHDQSDIGWKRRTRHPVCAGQPNRLSLEEYQLMSDANRGAGHWMLLAKFLRSSQPSTLPARG